MSLNTKKYWLDGIFDDEEFVVPKEDLKPHVEVKSISLTSPVEKEIVVKWSWKEEIICRDFVRCISNSCRKRHYYGNKHNARYKWWNTKEEEKKTLERVLQRLERVEGAKIIYR